MELCECLLLLNVINVECKTFICIASKLLYLHISCSIAVKLFFSLAVCLLFSVCKFALLDRFCHDLFCFIVIFSSMSVFFTYLLPLVLLQPVAKCLIHLLHVKLEAFLDNTLS